MFRQSIWTELLKSNSIRIFETEFLIFGKTLPKTMKNLKLFPVLIFIMAAFMGSCSDVEPIDPAIVLNPPTTNPQPSTPGTFKVEIDGTNFSTSVTTVYITGGSIQISALRPQGDSFGIMLSGNMPGTYQAHENLIAYNPAGSEYGYWGVNPASPNSPTGSITITNIDTAAKRISGTFSYTGYWSDDAAVGIPPKSFTNGVFTNLPYVTDSPSGDIFLAKVNGTDFNQNDLLVLTMGAGADEFIGIGASNAADQEITVGIRSSVGPGTYAITGSSTDDAQINFALSSSDFATGATSGSVTVQQKTATRIKGVFSGTVVIDGTTYAITQGSFDVEY